LIFGMADADLRIPVCDSVESTFIKKLKAFIASDGFIMSIFMFLDDF
jgi:hypothetical protein